MPTLAQFQQWVLTYMQVPSAIVTLSAVWLQYSFNQSMNTANQLMASWCTLAPAGAWTPYELAVYNLGGDLLINMAPDVAGSPPDGTGGFWTGLRTQFNCASFQAGVVNTAGDNGTSDSLSVVPSLEALTIDQLQNTKTPYGRFYLGYASKIGTVWGLS